MTARQRDDGFIAASLLFIIGMAVVFLVLRVFAEQDIADKSKQQHVCEGKGGIYYCGYRSACLCFAPGTVLP